MKLEDGMPANRRALRRRRFTMPMITIWTVPPARTTWDARLLERFPTAMQILDAWQSPERAVRVAAVKAWCQALLKIGFKRHELTRLVLGER